MIMTGVHFGGNTAGHTSSFQHFSDGQTKQIPQFIRRMKGLNLYEIRSFRITSRKTV